MQQPRTRFGKALGETFRDPELYAQRVLPILAVAETIGTRGASPGVSAMGQQKAIYGSLERQEQQQERERERREREGEAKQKAYERVLKEQMSQEFETLDPAAPDYEQTRGGLIRKYFPKEYATAALREKKEEDLPTLTPEQLAGLNDKETMLYMYAPKEFARYWKSKLLSEGKPSFFESVGEAIAMAAGLGRGKIEQDVAKKQRAQEQKTVQQFERVVSMGKKLWDTKQAALKEPFVKGGGPIRGPLKKLGAQLQLPGFEAVEAYEGQLTEMSLAMMPILTNQNRMIESVMMMVRGTLPKVGEKETYAGRKIEQTMRNMIGLKKAIFRAGITSKTFAGYTDEELLDPTSEINQRIKELQLAPAELDAKEQAEATILVRNIIGYVPSLKEKPPLTPVRDYTKLLESFRQPVPTAQPGGLSPEDQSALEWATENPGDPRAAEIRKRLGR